MPGRQIRRLTALALGWLGLGGVLWLSVNWLQLRPVASNAAEGRPEISAQAAELVHYDGAGRKVWTLTAQRIDVDEQSRTTTLEEVKAVFWNAQAVRLTVRAGRLSFDNLRQDLSLSGGVEAVDREGMRFRAERARWSEREQVLEGQGPVEVTRQDLRLEGQAFRYDARGGTLLIQQGAHLRWSPPGEDGP